MAVFLYGFAKKERENIEPDELAELRKVGLNWLTALPLMIAQAIEQKILQEVE